MESQYPQLHFDLARDCLVVALRWVAMEEPPSPEMPPDQGIRIELRLNRNSVLGPSIVRRRELDSPLLLRANGARVREVLSAAGRSSMVDLQLVIHGSIANAPFAALFHLRDYAGEAIERAPLPATPLLQLQPSTPGDRWHVAGQANLRVRLVLAGSRHLRVLRGSDEPS